MLYHDASGRLDGHACLKAKCLYCLLDGPLFISVVTDKTVSWLWAVISLYAQYSPLPLLPLKSIYILHSIETYWCSAKPTEAGKFAKIVDFSAVEKHLADILISGLATWTALHQSDEVLPVSQSQSYNAYLLLSIAPLHFIASYTNAVVRKPPNGTAKHDRVTVWITVITKWRAWQANAASKIYLAVSY